MLLGMLIFYMAYINISDLLHSPTMEIWLPSPSAFAATSPTIHWFSGNEHIGIVLAYQDFPVQQRKTDNHCTWMHARMSHTRDSWRKWGVSWSPLVGIWVRQMKEDWGGNAEMIQTEETAGTMEHKKEHHFPLSQPHRIIAPQSFTPSSSG